MISSEQLRAARAMLQWRAIDLVEKSGVALSTVQRAEKGSGPVPMIPANEKAVRAALEVSGIEFLPDGGVRLRESQA